MGGKPQTHTPADMRLKRNKAKYGSIANRDAAKVKKAPSMKMGMKQSNDHDYDDKC
jgi:hypothetical protein